jgi:class 3 adenylate cyclase/tetratricopeptide (TPR) repeat protein
MSAVLDTLASYVPVVILERLALRPEPLRAPLAETRLGALLLADISGFSRLTRQHAGNTSAGAELLGQTLNHLFSELIHLVHAHGGDVLAFAGDALFAFWPADDGDLALAAERAGTCGLTMQVVLHNRQDLTHPAISLRVGLAAGPVSLLHVGGHSGRWEMLVAGECLTRLSQAKLAAAPGEVVCTPAVWPDIADRFIGRPLNDGHVRLLTPTRALRWQRRTEPTLHPDMQRALHQYLPPSVRERLLAGQTEWLADLRQVTAMFVNLPDLDADASLQDVQRVMLLMQEILARFEGSFKELTTDDHGVVLVAVFGLPPLSHPDDGGRCVQAALAIQERLAEAGMRHAIGIATGQAFCGVVGSEQRRQFAILGDVMVRAARLMQMAPETIWCDKTTWHTAQSRFRFTELAPVPLKGLEAPIPVFCPHRRETAAEPVASPLLGRETELRDLLRRVNTLAVGRHGSVSLIEGEAGIGKSHLLRALGDAAAAQGLQVLCGQADPYERSQPYRAWRPIIERLFDWAQAPADPDERATHVRRQLVACGQDPAQAPLLSGLLPVAIPETETTRSLTGKVRAERLHELLIARLAWMAQRQPLLLILEDAHWFDSSSWALAVYVSRAVPVVMLVISLRPLNEPVPDEYRLLRGDPRLYHLSLTGLGQEAVAALVAARLGATTLEPALVRLIHERAAGHPLFSEEIAYALRDQGWITVNGGTGSLTGDDRSLAVPDLPSSVVGVITSRIDRLTPSQQLILKAASVIGRTFLAGQLQEVFPLPERNLRMADQLDILRRQDLIHVDEATGDRQYRFKHAIIQETVYGLMLREQRQQLHQAIAQWYERHHGDELSAYFTVLAHHWANAADYQRGLTYLLKAGEQALRRGAYVEAVRLLREALMLTCQHPGVTPTGGRVALERQLGEAYLGAGQLPEAKLHLEQSLALAGRTLPRTRVGLALALCREIARQVRHRWRLPALEVSPEQRERLLGETQALWSLCQAHFFQNDLPWLGLTALQALNVAERAGASPYLAQAYAALCMQCSVVGLRRLADRYADLAEAQIAASAPAEISLSALAMTAGHRLSTMGWHHTVGVLDQALTRFDRIGDHKQRGYVLQMLSFAHRGQGNLTSSLELLQRLQTQAVLHGDVQQQSWALTGQAICRYRQGHLAEAARLVEAAEPLQVASSDMMQSLSNQALTALLAHRAGDTDRARTLADEVLHALQRHRPRLANAFVAYMFTAETALVIWEVGTPTKQVARYADSQRAKLACELMRAFGRKVPAAGPLAHTMQGTYLWLSGHPAKARQSWQQGIDAALQLNQPHDEGRAHLELARHLPDQDSARRPHYERARDLLQPMGIWEAALQQYQPITRSGSGPLQQADRP